MIIFLDIETTGLDPTVDRILEVAAVEVTPAMEPVRGISSVIQHDPAKCNMVEYVRDMHTRSGLLAALPTGLAFGLARDRFLEWLGPGPHTLAGDSVHFDRSFLIAQWPAVAAQFSHRLLDVSAFNVARAVLGLPACPILGGNHRAEADVLASIARARWHLSRIAA